MNDMRVIVGGRSSGKTTRMLAWLTEEGHEDEARVFVADTPKEAMRLLHDARRHDLDVESWQFISMNELFNPGSGFMSGILYGRHSHLVLGIDNLDHWLARMLPFAVGALSLTSGDIVTLTDEAKENR